MNKKLIAVAVASAFGIPSLALAQFSVPNGVAGSNASGSSVTISGKLNYIGGFYQNGAAGNGITTAAGVTSVGTVGALSSHSGINNSESQVDIKGAEALGGGLSAWFQCGTSIDLLGVGAATGTAGLCGRNSAIGMKGNFGNAYIGNWDTPQKMAMSRFTMFSQSEPLGNSLLFNGAASADSGNVALASTISALSQNGGGANMWRRQSRLMTYITPIISGFQASVGMSADNEVAFQSAGTGNQKPRLYSFGATYDNGPVTLGLGVETHKGYNPGALAASTVTVAAAGNAGATNGAGQMNGNYSGGTDVIMNYAAKYSFGDKGFVNFIYSDIKYQVSGDLNTTLKNWTVNGQWNLGGPHAIRLGYVNVGSTGGTYGSGAVTDLKPKNIGQALANGGAGNTGAQKYQAEYVYAFSKRTELGARYAMVKNDSQANYFIGAGGTVGGYGQTQSYTGLRLTHSF